MLPQLFIAMLQKSPHGGKWTYVIWPESARFFRTLAQVKISGKIDGYPFRSCFMAMDDGQHLLTVKAEIRKAIGKEVGDTVTVLMEERLPG